MLKNRTVQLMYQTIYCTLGLVGCVACFGIFDDIDNFRWDFYTYFTNLSNFLCLGVMIVALVQTVQKKQDDFVKALPLLKFIGMLGIVLTFLVFNVMLAPARDAQLNWRIGSICFHVILPIMYIADWFLFYERKNTTWRYPIASISFPLGYAIFLFIHAAILGFNSSILTPTGSVLIYPYFFVNLETQSVGGVLMWIAILSAAFALMGFIFYGLDRLGKKKIEK